MSVGERVLASVVGQFHRPHGVGGRLAGSVMAHRRSNRDRNHWVVSLLDVQPTDRVLEIGFGPTHRPLLVFLPVDVTVRIH